MTAYLLDTNHASAFMSGEQPLTSRITRLAEQGERFYLCITVIGELYFAVYASKYQNYNMINLKRLIDKIAIMDFDHAAAEEYGRIKSELKTKGRPIPGTDAQIAAVARLHTLTVLSTDHHFQYIANLQTENWRV
jgi:tRNA(fMet)-specific endonuclease VapC